MTDAVVLLAISQLVCLGGLCYLVRQIQRLKVDLAAAIEDRLEAEQAFEPSPALSRDDVGGAFATEAASLAARLDELGLDIPALARRMRRSEQEVRTLLQSYGVRQ